MTPEAPTTWEIFAAVSRMECLKLRSLRSTWWMLAAYAAVMTGIAILALSVLTPGIMSPSGLASFDPTNQGFTGAVIGEIIVGVFGVLAFTGEYSSGMIRATLAAVPRRHGAFGAKVFVVGIAALACSELLAFSTFFAGEAALRASLPHASLDQPGVARAVLMGGAYLFLVTLIGLGLGALLRHGAAAIGVLLGLLFALPLLVRPLPHYASILKFLPEQVAANSLTAVKPVPAALSPWGGLLIMCLYAAVVLAAGYWAFTRRDAWLLAAVAEHRPDAAIVDIQMPPPYTDEGLRAALSLRADHPGTGILVFSQYVERTYTARLLAADGAAGVGYLLKDRVGCVPEFVAALERVAAGGTALDPEVVSELMRAQRAGLSSLTPRERQVLSAMAEGRSNAGIAAALVLSEGAVEKHIASIFGKLNLEPIAEDNRRVLAVLRFLQL